MDTACPPQARKVLFDPRRCLEYVPNQVEGLTILEGPRSEASIIRDMVPVICNGQVLFNRMQAQDPLLNAGWVVFRVVVEHTGEVIAADIEESTIQSDSFMRKISDFIVDTDFTGYPKNDTDTVFLYPAHF